MQYYLSYIYMVNYINRKEIKYMQYYLNLVDIELQHFFLFTKIPIFQKYAISNLLIFI